MATRDTYREYWAARRERAKETIKSGLCVISHVKVSKKGRLHVTCPYNSTFVRRAREIGGIWKYRSGVWSFQMISKKLVVQICDEIYGRDKVEICGEEQE